MLPRRSTNLAGLAVAAGLRALHRLTWRHGSRKNARNPTAAMRSRFLALRVRPANRDILRNPDGSLPECWLIAEWPPGKSEPTDYWLSNLPLDTPLRELVRLAKIRWRIEHDYRELKDGLGLDHFEGRSYIGWHRHVTLTALAQAFCTQLRYDPKPLRRPDPLRRTPRTPDPARHLDRRLPHLSATRPDTTTHPSRLDLTKYY
jgi:SRSO17 transposase